MDTVPDRFYNESTVLARRRTYPRRRDYRLTIAGLRQVTHEARSFERLAGAAHAKNLVRRSIARLA